MRRATIRTDHDDPDLLARALEPDNTAEMETTVEDDGTLVTHIERETTSGLHSTVDDYVINLDVAIDVTADATDGNVKHRQPTDAGPASDQDHTNNNE
ncbi:KEOPS complex Pcc1-like subunit [Halobiforma lacisalsi AJ5]|uniref:KEOPS complex Pcc1-like subunit n=1 Tax=Natronobacterium lacisalsi AJ5 TaxID=358396 RepID=M0LNR7_NATLA|nr:KEOPS complex subunit Pcc1 [Halobiforma lacisalsi]APW99369.1 KEOPS complex Pcc1-like subunit [Halobiforma lacisalsi AJ5]EMA35197.1 KEOPS complex Pcc1-like subunit [Halobiforma lacisalsi AJ5]